eukprot:15465710-Alexandrium_andersonii.AAC.1
MAHPTQHRALTGQHARHASTHGQHARRTRGRPRCDGTGSRAWLLLFRARRGRNPRAPAHTHTRTRTHA